MDKRDCENGFFIIIGLLLFTAFVMVFNSCKSKNARTKRAGFHGTPHVAYKGLDTRNELRYDPDGSRINLENMNNILNLDIETADTRYQGAENPMWTLDVSYLNPQIGGFQPIGFDDNSYVNVNPRSTFCSTFKQEWANKTPQVQDVELNNMKATSDAFNCDWNDFRKLYCSQKPAIVGVRDFGCDPTDYPGACKSLIETYGMMSPQDKLSQYENYKQNARLLRCTPRAIEKLFCRSLDVKDGVLNYGCNPDWYL